MKRSRKSLVALLLVLCMVTAFVVPAAFAEGEMIVYDFGNPNAAGEYRGLDACQPDEPIALRGNAANVTNDAYLLNCNSGRGFNIANSVVSFRANASKWWFAVELSGVKAGTYDLNILVKLKEASSNGGGIANVYFVKDQDYEAAFAATSMPALFATAEKDENIGDVTLIDYLVENKMVAASFSLGPDATKTSWQKTGITFPANDDYVMIFRSTEKGAIDLSGLEMTVTGAIDTPAPSAADSVIQAIDAIGTVTLESEAAITAARTSYDALSEADKALVTNYSKLTDAETALAALKTENQPTESQKPDDQKPDDQNPDDQKSDDQKPGNSLLWIIVAVILVVGAGVAVVIITKKNSKKEQ